MALKDWNKLRVGEWFNEKKNQKIEIYWYFAHPDIVIHLWDFNKPMNKGGLSYLGPKKGFKTKSQALAFAKSYMRTH